MIGETEFDFYLNFSFRANNSFLCLRQCMFLKEESITFFDKCVWDYFLAKLYKFFSILIAEPENFYPIFKMFKKPIFLILLVDAVKIMVDR